MAKILSEIFPNGIHLSDLTPPPPLAPDIQLRTAIADAGLTPPDEIIMDGKLRRFSTNGKRGDMAGWYVAYDDGKGPPGGAFGDWRQGVETTWRADIGRELSVVEQMQHAARMRDLKAQREKEIAILRQEAAEDASAIWQAAPLASEQHPYFQRKGISNPGLKLHTDGRLIAPVFAGDELASLQFIAGDGKKLFLKGGRTAGGWWCIGGELSSDCKRVYVAEGVATAQSVFEATGKPVAVAYSAGNMTATAQAVRELVGPLCEVVVVADNDESGTGQREGEKAAQAVGARLVIPPELGDANDYAQAGGDLAGLLEPIAPSNEWLIRADDFSAQPAPISWLVKHWIQSNALIMVHGPSGGGKTFVVLDWCLRMAAGIDEWAGHRVKPGAVVYLAGEGHHGLRGRVAAWKHKNQASSLNMWLSKSGCDLNTPEGYVRVANAIRDGGIKPTLIVVDTLHRFLSGDENSAQDAKTMLDACNGLMREFECTVILVHHTGVSEEAQHRARGSSAWKGALDIEISIIPAKGEQPMEIVQRKTKDSEFAAPVFAMLQSVEIPGWIDEDGEQVTSAVLEIVDAPDKPNKKEIDLQKEIKRMVKAWEESGGELIEQQPYISRSALIDYLITKEGVAESTAKTYCQDNKKGRLINKLIEAEIIKPAQHGWVVSEPATAATFLITKVA